MSNSNFNTVSPNQAPLDPSRRVKYTMGLVLGVDEFDQEQYYLMERDRLHQRALHGYGTVAGLKVAVTGDSGVPKIMVSPGIAVNPRGDTICVPENQCASLADWLKDNAKEVEAQLGSPPVVDGLVTLYVTLCCKECLTDNVPIPGAPCRSKEDIMAPSRIADYFELSIAAIPPEQLEEQYVRCFGKFLRRIEISTYAPNPLDKDRLVKELKDLFSGMGSPPECPLNDETSPPDTDKYYISPDNAAGVLEAVFRTWVTDIRPALLEKAGFCRAYSGKPESSGLCVLLAQLDVNVKESGGTWQVDGDIGDIEIIEDRRPVLLHTRLLQEWLLFGGYYPLKPDTHTFASLVVRMPDIIRVWVHHPELLEIPIDALKIEINHLTLTSSSIHRIPGTNVFDISLNLPAPIAVLLKQSFGYNTRVKVGFDVTRINEITGSSSTEKLSDVLLTLDYTYLDRDGDFLWSYSNAAYPFLDNLVDVDVPSPGNDQILTWNSGTGQWIATDKPVVITEHHDLHGHDDYDDHPQYLNIARANNWGDARYSLLGHTHPSSGLSLEETAAQLPVLPFVTIKRVPRTVKFPDFPTFELWFHLNADTDLTKCNLPELAEGFPMQVYGETIDPVPPSWPFMKKITVEDMVPAPGKRNVFLLFLNNSVDSYEYLRFRFDTDGMGLVGPSPSMTLTEWIVNRHGRPMKWLGHDGEGTITAFYQNSIKNKYEVTAAGQFQFDSSTRLGIKPVGPTLNGLTAEYDNQLLRVLLHFNGYNEAFNYIVNGTPTKGDKQTWVMGLMVRGNSDRGIELSIPTYTALRGTGFRVEISQIL